MKKNLIFLFHFFTDRKLYYLLTGLILLGGVSLIVMDRYVMPAYTLHEQGVTVPDVSRMPLDDAVEILESRGLRHELAAKRSNDAFPPDYVIDQTPGSGMIVKPDRKIYITINATSTPTVVVPEVEDLSLRNATIQLQNSGLQVGNITHESSPFRNSVLRQSVPPGREVHQNTSVDLVVGDGLGSDMVAMPDLSNMHLTEAQNSLQEAGLRVGEIRFEATDRVVPNTVLRHDPDDHAVYEGTAVNLVISTSPDEDEEEETGPVIIDESENDTDQAGETEELEDIENETDN